MKQMTFLLLLSIVLFSCTNREDIQCDNAQLQICNSTTNQIVVYGWNTNQIDDTIFPGECTIKDFGEVSITYGFLGFEEESQTSAGYFHTNGATYALDMESCYRIIEAPGGYLDISHCYNGVFDGDKGEFDVDCGGFCPPCENVSAPCSTNVLSNEIDWQTGADDNYGNFFETIIDSRMQISGQFSNGSKLDVTIPVSSFPTANRKFIIGSEYYEAELKYKNRFEEFDTEQGKTIYFITKGDGTGKIEFCDLKFTAGFNTKIGSGSIGFRD